MVLSRRARRSALERTPERTRARYVGGGDSGQLLLTVELLERLELLNQRLVLVLEHGHPALQTLDVLLLLPPTLTRSLPADGEGNSHDLITPDRYLTRLLF